MTRFIPHGEVRVHREGRILILEGHGPWNVEALQHSTDKAQPILQELSGAPWGVMASIYGEPIHVPDAEAHLIELVKRDIENGRVGTALIVEKSNSPSFATQHFSSIYHRAGDNVEVFNDIKAAKCWLMKTIQLAQSNLEKMQ
ncbi:hypothetical protein MTsDn5_03740 [Alteromonas gracilis]|jgi:hypothetical protein|uniref:hypothetical protein n=1 Tax=Alteromonas gracilis TaxID=1479524 RepID=UPI0036F330EB